MAKIDSLYIGTAGWNIPAHLKPLFPSEGTHLQRYSRVFNAVEINSSFYKNHKATTYRKWAAETPDHFRFSVKLNKYFIHEKRFLESDHFLRVTVDGIKELGEKLDVLLVQLPPSLSFEAKPVAKFLKNLRHYYDQQIAWEPRHPSWGSSAALKLLNDFNIAKVFADPEPCPSEILSCDLTQYHRWHGSPDIYRSRYSLQSLQNLAATLQAPAPEKTWVIFDNTTFGHATENALELKQLVESRHVNRDAFRPDEGRTIS